MMHNKKPRAAECPVRHAMTLHDIVSLVTVAIERAAHCSIADDWSSVYYYQRL
jgi:hypothetical protein